MESKIAEHFFAYFILVALFDLMGVFILVLLDVLGIKNFWLFFLIMAVLFVPIAKFWNRKFFKRSKNSK